MSYTQFWAGLIGAIIGGALSMVGVVVAAILTANRERTTRKHAYIRQQLQEFYSPLLGLRQEIRTRSELRMKLEAAAGEAWPELTEEARQAGGTAALQKLQVERWPEFEAMTKWDNDTFNKKLLPAYREMVDLFRRQLWLADAETVTFLSDLVEFVEVWERNQAGAIPYEVVRTIGHGEAKLASFYAHIEAKHEQLRAVLARG